MKLQVQKETIIDNIMSGYYIEHSQGDALLILDLNEMLKDYETEIDELETNLSEAEDEIYNMESA